MTSLKDFLKETYKVNILKQENDYIVFETNKNDNILSLFEKIKVINSTNIIDIKIYYLGINKTLNIYKMILRNSLDEAKLIELLKREETVVEQ